MLEDLFFIEYEFHLLLFSNANDEALIIERNNLRKKLNYYKLVELFSIVFINSFSFLNSINITDRFAILPSDLLFKKGFDCVITNSIS